MLRPLLLAATAVAAAALPAAPAAAQQFLGNDAWGTPICSGPFGPGRCADVYAFLQRQQMAPPPMAPQPGGMAGLPGAGVLPQDGQIVAGIYQTCGGEPRCMAIAWGAVEVQRCRNGVGVPGGCFGPNGEIMRIIDRNVPQNLRPDVVLHNMESDIRNGPGPNNEICRLTPFC